MQSRHVDLTVLIQDAHGQISEQFSGGEEKKPDLEQGRKKSAKTLYRKIANSDCEVSYEHLICALMTIILIQELKSHECFATLTNIIWIDYGIVQG